MSYSSVVRLRTEARRVDRTETDESCRTRLWFASVSVLSTRLASVLSTRLASLRLCHHEVCG